jgi:hypothetical protein
MRCAPALLMVSRVQLAPSSERPAANALGIRRIMFTVEGIGDVVVPPLDGTRS